MNTHTQNASSPAQPQFRLYFDPYGGPDGGAAGSYGVNLNAQATVSSDLSPEMRTWYSDYLIDEAEPELVHDQFGQKHPIPKNGGKTIQFRQFDQLPELTTPLTEGVTPDGQSLKVNAVTATVEQYGGYVGITDMLMLTAIDPVLTAATKKIASQAGRTLDTLTREALAAGTNVRYAGGAASRSALANSDTDHLTVEEVKKAVRDLEVQDAPKIDGYYIGIVHPRVKFDLMKDPLWRSPHEYADPKNIYQNEIGELYGVRFVDSSRAKVWHAEDLAGDARTLTVNAPGEGQAAGGLSGATTIPFDGGTVAEHALKGRKVLVGTSLVTVLDNTASQFTVAAADAVTCADNTVIYPGEAGAGGADVFGTLILGADAYGVTEVRGGGLEHIVKQLGSAGSADPMNQRATCAWKATKVAKILVQQYLVRVESTATV